MPRSSLKAHRVQVYLSDARIAAALAREARTGRIPVSQAAARAIARGLQSSPKADPDDRLLKLELGLRDHMRAMGRDMQIVQELVVELARAFFTRLPDAITDDDPTLRASVEIRIDRLLDATAARIVTGRSREALAVAEEARSFGGPGR